VWHVILNAELYTACPGERVLVAVVTLYYTTSTRLYAEKRIAVSRATVKTE